MTSAVSLSASEVRTHAAEGKYNLLPVFIDVQADMETPVSAFLKLRTPDHCFLLESVEGGERQARYSFLGTHPYKVIRESERDPLVAVEAEMKAWSVLPVQQLPTLAGGAVGYVAYDCVRHFEPSVRVADADPLDIPESVFMFFRWLVAFDHVKHCVKAITHIVVTDAMRAGDEGAVAKAYAQALDELAAIRLALEGPLPHESRPPNRPHANELKSNVGAEGYKAFVRKLKEDIVQGEIIQAVPSQRVACRLTNAHAFDLYRSLRTVNPSPYMFYLHLGGFEVVGASPEQLVKVDAAGTVTNHPIAGTRRRGATDEEDAALAAELLANEKERAEHIMLVDLGRNDVGRVARAGTVRVDSLMHIEKYSHVMHIVSNVSGKLADDKTPYDAFRAVFPAGTVSGAPKIRAMQLVSELEQQRRGVYAGAVGYVSFTGVLDTCISIRTMVVKDGTAYLQAGGGIVYDSDPGEEHEESMNKMKALARAIEHAEEGLAREAETKRDTVMKNYPPNVTELCGEFGRFGGRYVPETLVGALEDLEAEYVKVINDRSFRDELRTLQQTYVGRATPLYLAKRLTEHAGGARIWLKREDLAHTGAHKINNALGQGLLAKRMGKRRVIAETGAGQHGVATATACALLGLECVIYMGEEDIHRQSLNVFRIKMLGGTVVPVTSGSKTLKDAVNEAMRDWVANVDHTFFLIGSAIGPHPFPTIVRDFQCCIGEEVRAQMLAQAGRLPDLAIACVGGGSNSIGLFHPLLEDAAVRLVGVEAAGHGLHTTQHSATIVGGSVGVLHGTRTFLLQDADGQIKPTHSISAGLDYPGVGPEHAHLKDSGRVEYVAVTDEEALDALKTLTSLEGIIPALESAHAVHTTIEMAGKMAADQDVVLLVSGRGDKDMVQVCKVLGVEL